jgi:hypothetical protein
VGWEGKATVAGAGSGVAGGWVAGGWVAAASVAAATGAAHRATSQSQCRCGCRSAA